MSRAQSKDITNLINKFLDLKTAYVLIGKCLEQQSWHPRLAIFVCDCKELVFIYDNHHFKPCREHSLPEVLKGEITKHQPRW